MLSSQISSSHQTQRQGSIFETSASSNPNNCTVYEILMATIGVEKKRLLLAARMDEDLIIYESYKTIPGEDQKKQVAQWLEESRNYQGEPIHWTLSKLALAIETEFGIKMGQTAVWRLVRQLGFRQKVPRPRHAKADAQAQESFKKNP